MQLIQLKRHFLLISTFLCLIFNTSAQNAREVLKLDKREIRWSAPVNSAFSDTEKRSFLSFDGVTYDAERDFLPLFTESRKLPIGSTSATAKIYNAIYTPLDQASLISIGRSTSFLSDQVKIEVSVLISRREPIANVSIIPLRINAVTGQVEKLLSFDIEIQSSENANRIVPFSQFASNSVLASGTWHRIGVTLNGVYKVDYNFLAGLGLDMSTLDPATIRLYGNGHGQLPFSNSGIHQDDLNEYAIEVQDQNSNGIFDSNDLMLFYGTTPNSWTFNSGDNHFHHAVHKYCDTTYYFLTTDLGPGKRILSQASTITPPNQIVNAFDDYQFHEYDNENLIKSGREWYGEKFDILNSYSFAFVFPNIVDTSNASVEVNLISRCDIANSYAVNAQTTSGVLSTGFISSACYYCTYAASGNTNISFHPTNSLINVSITKQNATAVGWLNWIRVNARRKLIMNGSQMSFRDSRTAGLGNISQFTLDGAMPSLKVWDVSDLSNVALQSTVSVNTTLEWKIPTDYVHEFIAFDGLSFQTPVNFGTVANQNLHSMQAVDFIIVTHPDFQTQAQELADLHSTFDSLSYLIVNPQQIYNEFSSGMQDVTAIRDFVRMIYSRALSQTDLPRYLLLYGDGSYDNKHRLPSNSNFIPTFQNLNSLTPTESYVSDQYFTLLDDAGGWDSGSDVGAMDIGVGRFPVRSGYEAQVMVDKVRQYMTRQTPVSNVAVCATDRCSNGGEWKNWIAFIGDDEDSDIHMSQANQLATFVDTTYDNFNIDKIYLDAYQQQQTPGGERYPDVNAAIDKRQALGSLILNYTGHGGEVGWAHERILEVSQVNGWTNSCNMPLFVTATCEFSRYDDPFRTSAGEYVLLNSAGGGIGLLTTVRLVYSTPNFVLNQNFYECAFEKVNGEMPRLGDLYRITQVSSGNNTNNRNFTLLGDPALRLNYPINSVATAEVNHVVITSQPDTLRALSFVTIKGFVSDSLGNILPNFNGILYPSVFDKAKMITTLANDPPNPAFTFLLQKSVLYHGKASVVNGYFEFSFVVPKDIAYQYGLGRLSYFADNGITDASGSFENIIIGGSNPNAPTDVTGPQLKLYLNDSNFVFGGITNNSPKLFAVVLDSNGVNTVGNGIGHDVVAILDDETANAIVLNDYYQSDINSYQSGKIIYPFSSLEQGKHTLSLKVWDVYNNSTTVKTEFTVTNPEVLTLNHVLNYPNPFTTHTSFYMEYNQCCVDYDIMIQVFTVSGKLVKTMNEHVASEGFRSEAIDWDGKDDYGDFLGRGVYIYHVVARTSDGKTADKFEKLVILK